MDELALGRLGSPFGLRGHLRFTSYSGETAHIYKLKEVSLRGEGTTRSARVVSVIESANGVAIRFEGIESPEEARAYVGLELYAPRSAASPRRKNEYYIADLVGCELLREGKSLGAVLAVCDGGGGQLLELRLADGRQAYVPFRNEFVGKVDLGAKTIELLATWILE